MNNTMKAALLAVVAGLAGCNGSSSNEPAPTSSVPVLGEGALQGYANGDTVSGASIYTNKDGKGYVLLSADGDGAATVMHVVDGSKGRRVPVSVGGMVTLAYDRTQALVLNALSPANAAGNYQALIGGKPALFTVAADGAISAGGSDCKLSGKVDFAATYGGAAALTLTASGCGSAAEGSYRGLALASADTAPAALQLVGENGNAVLDVLAYR
ncbi:hypothetical protein [Duganella sp. HH105]|uniref:hypothetical protein n=1 Tax=Duganella sp. HH105 TaxID=1781067 RepID=UPI000877BC96|nr:hypothetical protein [Duganella sp. HH105]OEZ62800.1 hypothetical protein DUGA6_15870 [Duganella sp. HH105]